jgi:hypothetical protein
VEGSLNEPQATVLLCDAAESVNGKLYILGAGWSQMLADSPTNMSLAVKLLIPWNRANETLTLRASLVDEDSEEPVDLGRGPLMAEGNLEIGRPAGLRRGAPLDASFVLNFPGVSLPQGGYVWKIEVSGTERARIPIQALIPQGSA